MQRKDRIDAFGGSLLLAFSLLLGLNHALVKLVNAGFHPVFQAGLRSAFAFFPVLIYALVMRKKLSLIDGSLWPGLLAGLFFALEFLLLFQGIELTTVGRAAVFLYTMPFWVCLAAHFLIPGEALTARRLAGLLLAFAGVAWALLGRDQAAGADAVLGDVFCVLAALLWAGIVVLARTTKFATSTPEMQLLYQLSVSALVLLALAPAFASPLRDPTPVILAIFSFQVLVVVAMGFLGWFWVLSVYPASDMASFGFLTPLFGVFFGWLILDEEISSAIIGALVMVSAGIVLINRKPGSASPRISDRQL